MDNVSTQMQEARIKYRKKLEEFIKFADENQQHMDDLANGLDVVREYIIAINLDGVTSVDISIAGDHNVFKGLFSALRKLNYKPAFPPQEEKFAAWSGFFHSEDPANPVSVWVTFSSTKCKRVKVGEETITRDLYEIVCDETPETT